MTPLKLTLYLSCVLWGRMAHVTTLKSSSSLRLLSFNQGDNATLPCFGEGQSAVMFYWYKQTLGQKPRLMSSYYRHNDNGVFHDEFKNNSRFTLDSENVKNHLRISDLRLSDSATYYCMSSDLQNFEILAGVVVSVKGSGQNNQALVHQPASATIQPGASVPLNCTMQTRTCDGEHSVYWFRSSAESHPAIVYSHGVRNDQCERKSKTETQTCFYNFPINVSDLETYVCAVASCGEMLFGNWTKLETEHNMDYLVLVYILIGVLAFTTSLVALLSASVCKMIRRNSCNCTAISTADSTPNAEGYQDEGDVHYVAFREIQGNRSRRETKNINSQCVYSSIRQQSST